MDHIIVIRERYFTFWYDYHHSPVCFYVIKVNDISYFPAYILILRFDFNSINFYYKDDNFDIPDRTFHALATTWRLTSCDSTTDVKELIPEFFYLPEFLLNSEGNILYYTQISTIMFNRCLLRFLLGFNFGIRQNGNRVGDVELPKWCGGDARLFILAHRAALEADVVREVLPYWIDLVFGFRQTGRPAVEAINVFHPAVCLYQDSTDICLKC